jgi:hypothetical protein
MVLVVKSECVSLNISACLRLIDTATSRSADDYWPSVLLTRLADVEGVDLRSPRDAIFRARTIFDHELGAVERMVRDLRRRRNTLVPISILPSDILAAIFELCGDNDTWESMRRPACLSSSHVCTAWRDTALQYPRVWRRIPLNAHNLLLEACLARSKSAPIILLHRAGDDFPRRKPIISNDRYRDHGNLVHHHLSHVEEISFSAYTRGLQHIADALTSPAPFLTKIRLIFIRYHPATRLADLPHSFLAGHAPLLGELTLSGVNFSWSSIPASNLQSLSVTFPDRDHLSVGFSSSLSDLLQCLSRTTRLESLHLHNCFPSVHTPPADFSVMNLDQLKILTITGGPDDCEAMWRILRFPLTVELQVNVTFNFSSSSYEPSSFINLFIPHLQSTRNDANRVEMLSIENPATSLFIHSWTNFNPSWRSDGFAVTPAATLALVKPERIATSDVELLLQTVPLGALRALHVHSSSIHMQEERWQALLSGAMQVETLSLEGRTAVALCAALDSGEGTLFPSLRTLILEEVVFHELYEGRSLYDILLNMVERRHRDGFSLGALHIRSCVVNPDWARRFEDIEGLVIKWDGVLGFWDGPGEIDFLGASDGDEEDM